MNSLTKAEREYKALSVKEKLLFDPSGRQGAVRIREDQDRLKELRNKVKQRTKSILGVRKNRVYKTQEQSHWERYQAWLQEQARLEAETLEKIQGNPREKFGMRFDVRAIPWTIKTNLTTNRLYKIGDWFFCLKETLIEEYDRYSKGWHKQFGPARHVENRRMLFAKDGDKNSLRVVQFKSWGGDILARAIIELDLQPKTKIPLNIRLNKAYNAEYYRTKIGYKIYKRTLLGDFADYVIVAPLGTTYHDSNYKKLFAGLAKKIKAEESRAIPKNGLIDWKACKKLGFCDSGIMAFCDAFGFDYKGKYAALEVAEKVAADQNAARPFFNELKTLAKAYKIDWRHYVNSEN